MKTTTQKAQPEKYLMPFVTLPWKKEEDMEMLHPNEPVKHYKSKMVPIWKREAEPEKTEESKQEPEKPQQSERTRQRKKEAL